MKCAIFPKTFSIFIISKKNKVPKHFILLYKISCYLLGLISNPPHLEFHVRASKTITLLETGKLTVSILCVSLLKLLFWNK